MRKAPWAYVLQQRLRCLHVKRGLHRIDGVMLTSIPCHRHANAADFAVDGLRFIAHNNPKVQYQTCHPIRAGMRGAAQVQG